jgi:hypothetical protein
MEINERFVKISGRIGPIPPGLVRDDEDIYLVINGLPFKCARVKIEHYDNQDGTCDEHTTFKQSEIPDYPMVSMVEGQVYHPDEKP